MSENSSESFNDSPADFELSETPITAPQVSPVPITKRHISLGVIAGICLLTLIGVALLTFHSNKSSNKPIAVKATQTTTATITPTSAPTQATPTGSQTQTGPGSAIPATPTMVPTPTPVVYGGGNTTATITFTRDSQSIHTPQNILTVASDGSGQFSGDTRTFTATHFQSPEIAFELTNASVMNIPMSVINHTSQTLLTQSYWTPRSKNAGNACQILGGITLPAGATVSVECDFRAPEHIPADNWDDTASVSNIEFVGHNDELAPAFGYIPAKCGNTDTLITQVEINLGDQIDYQTGFTEGNEVGRVYNVNFNSVTCNPPPGTYVWGPTPNGYIQYYQYVDASASALYYRGGDICTYQQQQLKTQIPTGYTLTSSQACYTFGTSNLNATATRGTITCGLTGTISYNWTNAQLQALAQRVAGKDKATAQAIVAATTGVAANSVTIDAPGNTLPQAANIKIVVNG